MNLDKLMSYRKLSGHGIATSAKRIGHSIDPKTVNNARNAAKEGHGKGDLTLSTLEGISAGASVDAWQLLAPRFDPQRLPELRKRWGESTRATPSDGYLDELIGLWSKMKPGRRATLLHLAQEWSSESGEAADPPDPPRASQRTR
jgi:hypothetical protein